MTDDRWAWVATDPDTDTLTPADDADVVDELDDAHVQEQHINTVAGTAALDLWNPTATPAAVAAPTDVPLTAPQTTGLASTAPAPGDAVRGGAEAPTEQFPVIVADAVVDEPLVADLGHAWADVPAPARDSLDQLVTDGRARRSRRRALRRAGIAAGFMAAAVAVVATVVVLVLPDDHPATTAQVSGPQPVSAWCPVGTRGDVTTVAAGGDGRSPQAAVAAFLSGLLDQRSPAAARAAMAQAATTPSVDDLRAWTARLPAGQIQWCARITATDSPARWQVAVTARSGDARPQPMSTDTFYVSASTPTTWVVDAIVAQEGTQP